MGIPRLSTIVLDMYRMKTLPNVTESSDVNEST